MPDIYGPFDSASWAQDQWYRYSPAWAPSGVFGKASDATSPSAGSFGLTVSGMDISLSLGRAWVYGAGYERTGTPWTATIPPNTSSNRRMDALVLRRDLAAKTLLPTVIQGTPAATPLPPTRQMDEAGQWDLPLHTFIVPADSGAPLNTVVDNRVWVDTQSSNYAVFSSGAALPVQAAYLPTTPTLTVSTTAPADVGLNLANVAAGTYLVDAFLHLNSAATTYWRLCRDTTSVATASTALAAVFGNGSTAIYVAGIAAAQVSSGVVATQVTIKGLLVLSAAKTVNLDVSAGESSKTLRPGSYLTMTKVA